MLKLLSVAAASVAAALVSQSLVQWRHRQFARRRLGPAPAASRGRGPAWLEEAWAAACDRLESLLPPAWRAAAASAIGKSGRPGMTPGRLAGRQAVCAASFWLVFTSLLGAGLAGLAAGIAGLLLPWISIRDAAARRLNLARRALPDAVDLLTTCLEAGLSFDLGLKRVHARLPEGPLRSELGAALSQMQLGQTRQEALKGLAQRLPLDELQSFVSALVQADQMGVSLAPVLRAQSLQMRSLKSLRAQKAAAQAPVKMLFPLMIFILPVVFLVLFGPLVLKLMQNGF